MADAWTSVVETEPEWDEHTRTMVEGLDQYEREVHACGLHSSILNDPEHNRFLLEENHCDMCAAIARRGRVLAEKDSAWAKANPEAAAKEVRPADGRSLVLRPVTPAELVEVRGQQTATGARGATQRGRPPSSRRPQ